MSLGLDIKVKCLQKKLETPYITQYALPFFISIYADRNRNKFNR